MINPNDNHRIMRLCALCAQILVLLMLSSYGAAAESAPRVINAFLLNELPVDYAYEELLFHRMREGGANTVIISPSWRNGVLDNNGMTHAVFLAHRNRMQLYVLLPTRSNSALLVKHSEWEDIRFDMTSRSFQRSGRIDLFQRSAIDAIASVARELASFSIDGILFDEDYYYDVYDGINDKALETFRRHYGKSFSAREVFTASISPDDISSADEDCRKMTVLKGDILIALYRAVAKAAWKENPRIRFGLPLHVSGLIPPQDEYTRYGYDVQRLTKMEIDFFWVPLRHRELRDQYSLSYAKTMELTARIVKSAVDFLQERSSLITIETDDRAGKLLPLTEIEEVVAMARHADGTGIAFMISPNSAISTALTKNMFRSKDR